MGKYLGIGNAGFTAIRKGTYIDKTGLISFVNKTLGTMQKLTCVSRPRRFGKSYAAKMLCAYYDKSCHSDHLFSGLEIANDPSYQKYLNRYDGRISWNETGGHASGYAVSCDRRYREQIYYYYRRMGRPVSRGKAGYSTAGGLHSAVARAL